MQSRPYAYLFGIQYLGLRYHGWQVQKGLKTIQGTLERVFRYVLGHEDFTVLGSSRTDSGVSCLHGGFVLYLREGLETESFLSMANEHLPADIRLLYGKPVPPDFNVIQDVKSKRYGYYFAIGDKPHAFYGANLTYAGSNLDLAKMHEGSRVFLGKHDFRRFCTQGRDIQDFEREIFTFDLSEVGDGGVFWPAGNTYVLRVEGDGFLMHQVRRMAAALFMLGRGELQVEDLEAALVDSTLSPISPKAPAQGLVLEEVSFNKI